MIFILLIVTVSADTSCFKSTFTSAKDSYCVGWKHEGGVYNNGELYERSKCKTCCRVLFASEYNYATGERFTDKDDRRGNKRFVIDTEFDDKSSVRLANEDMYGKE